MIQQHTYLRIVRASAWYDLVVTAGFATPWTFSLIYAQLVALAAALGLGGELPPMAPAHMLMANLLGSVVTVWAVLRLRDTQLHYGRYDAAARFLFATWQLVAVANGASTIILAFTAVELAFGIAQVLPVRQQHGREAADGFSSTGARVRAG